MPVRDEVARTACLGEVPFHYPTHLIDVWDLGRERLTLRPILPQDQGALGAMLHRTSAATRRARFHGVVNHFADETLRAMSRLDFSEVLALVVTTGSPTRRETVIADARYVVGVDGADAEFAIVIDHAWQRRGVGPGSSRRCSMLLATPVFGTWAMSCAAIRRCCRCCANCSSAAPTIPMTPAW